MGPDTLILGEPPEGVPVTKSVLTDIDDSPTYFDLRVPSALNRAVTAFKAERDRCKAEMKKIEKKLGGKEKAKKNEEWKALDLEQTAWKLLSNSAYGLTGAGKRRYNRYFAKEVAESITMGGRELHHLTEEWMGKEFGIPVVAGDTDSVFTPGILKERYGCPKSFVELEFEKLYVKLLLFKKKNYAGIIEGGKFEGKGLAFVKRENPEVAKRSMKGLIDSLLRHDKPASYYWGWLQKIKKMILHGPIPTEALEHYVIHKSVSKDLDSYKSEGIHVKVAKDKRAAGEEIYPGLVIRFIFVVPDGSREGREDALDVEDFQLSGRELDRQKYWKVYLLGKIQPVLELVFPDEDWASFDDTVVSKREKQKELWIKRMTDEKTAWKWFRKVRAEIRACPWLVDVERKELLGLLDPDERILLRAKLKKAIDRRLGKLENRRPADADCSVCGKGPVHRGDYETEKFHNDLSVCSYCGDEKKKQTRKD
jgi:DNA polymerase elongation subunit (family B)